MASHIFIDRKQELEHLETLYNKQIATLVVVKGRRRIGKSRLIAEFASKNPQNKLWDFADLAHSDGMTAQTQRDHFARQLVLLSKFLKDLP